MRPLPGRPFLKPTQELLGSTPGVVYERLFSFTTFQTLCRHVVACGEVVTKIYVDVKQE